MLSIDEVITALEQGPRSNIRDAAVMYLAEYKGLSKMWNDKLDKEQKNPSLTWDDLKAMEGKPVWIELHYKGCKPWSGWEIVDEVSNKWMTTNKDDYAREQMCEQWQAYLKESGEHETAKKLDNPTLTWDELKTMEGKPVWVEEKGMLSIWIIIGDVSENWLYSTDCNAYRHEEYGKIWNAYRKERERENA